VAAEGLAMKRVIALGLVFCLAVASVCWGAPTAEQKAEIKAINDLVAKAGGLFKEKKFGECAEVIKQVQAKIEALAESGDPSVLRQLATPHRQLTKAHQLLQLEAIELSELLPLPEAKKPARPAKPEKPMPAESPAAGGLSFVRHVAPVLIGKCGKCHVDQSKGDFSAASYASLMKGAGMAGKVIFPGDADGSRLIEVIVSGDMPRGGKLTQGEFDVLKKWINEGAKFDGGDENAKIATLTSATPPTPPATPAEPTIELATGKETVSFSGELAVVFASTCNGCHGTNQPRQNFSVATFLSLMKGGDGGPAVTPGDGPGSYLIKKLKGTGGGQRMPAGGLPALDEALIAKIETWIAEGAKFDGPDANAPLAQVAALAKAAGSTHEQLSADRAKAAEATWGTGMPGVKHDTVETANFYAQGTIGENTLKDLVQRAEQQIPKIAEMLGAPTDKPLVKGRFSVFAVNVRYDFEELGKVILNSDAPPKKVAGLWRYTGVDAAGAVMIPKAESEYAADVVIAEQATSAYLSGTGKNVPRWFAEGVGRAVAARLAPDDPRIEDWDANLALVHRSLSAPDAFMSAKFDPEVGAIASYSYCRYLMGDAKKFGSLLDGLRQGGKFDDAFAAAYGNTPNQKAEQWYAKGSKRRGKTR
jgi:mono/diheme cytochrome c family protein